MKVTVLSGGVGGARFLRGRRGCSRSRQRNHHRQRGGRHRGARPSRVAGPRQRALRPRRGRRRGARLGARGRVVERALDGRCARRRDVVPARRPRHRPAPAPERAPAAGRCALGGDEAARRGARAPERAAPGNRRPAAHVRRDTGRDVSVPGVVRRPRASRRGRRPPLHGSGGGATRSGSARGDRSCRPDRDRAEQPVRLDLADPGRLRDPRRDRAADRALRRRQPADRWPGSKGPRRQDARTDRRRHRPGRGRRLLPGADRRARDRRGGRALPSCRPGSARSSPGR